MYNIHVYNRADAVSELCPVQSCTVNTKQMFFGTLKDGCQGSIWYLKLTIDHIGVTFHDSHRGNLTYGPPFW